MAFGEVVVARLGNHLVCALGLPRDLVPANQVRRTNEEIVGVRVARRNLAGPQRFYSMVSVRVGTTELVSDPVMGLTGLPMTQIWVNDDNLGPFVGGSTIPPVPFGGVVAVGIALSLAAIGSRRFRLTNRSAPRDRTLLGDAPVS